LQLGPVPLKDLTFSGILETPVIRRLAGSFTRP
jgi:hypothetical protein